MVTKTRATRISGVIEALLYCRVSSELQRDGVSLDAQLRECRQYAARQGWVLGREYVDVMSGKRDDRPQYQEMLTDIRRLTSEGRRVAVVVWRLDRLGRRLLERVARREELKGLAVATHSATEGGEVNDLTANILASVAQEEVRVLAERVAGANRQLRASGWWPVRRPSFGYVLRDASPKERAAGAPRRVLDVDPVTGPMVEALYRRVANGASIRSTARWMASQPAELRGHLGWEKRTAQQILSAAVYVSRFEPEDGADVLAQPVGNWPAIISDDVYQRVQDALARHRVMPAQASGKYLLSGLVRCPKCDARMGGQPRTNQSDRYICTAFQCYMALHGPTLDASLLAQVTEVVERAARLDGRLRRALSQEWEALRSAVTPDSKRLAHLRSVVEKGRTRLANAATLFVDGDLDRVGYDALREKIEADTRAAQDELDRLENNITTPTLPPLAEVLARVTDWGSILTDGDIPSRRRLLADLVERIAPVKVGYGRYEARIIWTPLGDALRAAMTEKAA